MPEGDGESLDSMREKVRNLSDSVADIKGIARDLEGRIRDLETEEMHSIKKSLYQLEHQISNFRVRSDSNREKWSMVLNFVIQFIWVVTASYVLTKLGIGMGPL